MRLHLLIGAAALVGLGCVGETDDGLPDDEADDDDVSLAFATTDNLLKNRGFEAGWGAAAAYWAAWVDLCSPGWQSPDDYVRRSTAAAYGGTYGLRIKSPAGVCPIAGADYLIEAIPGRRYRARAMTRNRAGDEQRLYLIFTHGAGFAVHYVGTDTATSWHSVTLAATAPDDATYLWVGLGDWGFPDPLYGSTQDWDRISLIAL